MPSPLSADRPPAHPPGRGAAYALIPQTRRLKGGVDAARREAPDGTTDAPQGRRKRALLDPAPRRPRDPDRRPARLRDGPLPVADAPGGADPAAAGEPAGAPRGPLPSLAGSAEWNLLTDEAGWSVELYRILGLDPAGPALTLDELPSLALDEDRPLLTALVAGCLVDGRPVDGEFRVVRPDGAVRAVRMRGEPVLDADGATAAVRVVLRDTGESRRSRSAVRETRDSLRHRRCPPRGGHRLAVEPGEALSSSSHGFPRLPHPRGPALDLAAHHPLVPVHPDVDGPVGDGWCDALELADGDTVLAAGRLAGPDPDRATDPAMPPGALPGMAQLGALTGMVPPTRQPARLGRLLGAAPGPVLAGTVCCRYRPAARTLVWARAGGPAPLLFSDGTGRVLGAPDGAGQTEATLAIGDVLLLHTGGPAFGHGEADTVRRLLGLAPSFRTARSAQDCVRAVVAEFGADGHADGLGVLVARVLP